MKYVGAIDHGTTSTRFMIFSQDGEVVASSQVEHKQICPKPGWVEHDPEEIWRNTVGVIRDGLFKAGIKGSDLESIGITNQRETIIPFNRKTGQAYHNAIVWQDLRGTEYVEKLRKVVPDEKFKEITGLTYSPYFSASKIMWLIDNVPRVRAFLGSEDLVFGTIDTYLTFRLTQGRVVTDMTNASRYMLMNIATGKWDDTMLEATGIPKVNLPEIVPSMGMIYGLTDPDGPFQVSIPVAGILGDQQAALFGEACFTEGESKCTYGTGIFMLINTGSRLCRSEHGLLTTIAYQAAGEAPQYALEGSVAIAGSLLQWVRDDLELVGSSREIDQLAETVPDNGGVYIVPAFSGLFAPYWRSDARGIIVGLTRYARKAHICRAALEAAAFQANDLKKAMEEDAKVSIKVLKADGGMTKSMPLMAFQSDIMDIPVVRPRISETTCLGAAFASGLTTGVWSSIESLRGYWKEEVRWQPSMDDTERSKKVRYWKKAVEKSFGWAD